MRLRISILSSHVRSLSSSSLSWVSPLRYADKKPDPPSESSSSSLEARRKNKFITHVAAINLIKCERDPERALDVFNKVSEQKGFNHNNDTYSVVLDKLARCKKFRAVDAILHRMKYDTCKIHEGVFLNLMKHFSRFSLHEKVVEMFYMIEPIAREKPSLNAISTCLNLLVDSERRFKEAMELFEEMISKEQLLPDSLTYNVLINGFCQAGEVDRARSIIDFMKNNGCNPNLYNYSALMNGFSREGRVQEAKQIFDELKNVGLKPDTVWYTTLMNCLCRNGQTDEAIDLLREMQETGCKPDALTYNVVLRGLSREEGRLDEALEMLKQLTSEGVRLNKGSYRIVLNALCEKGELMKAVGLMGLMSERGFWPHHATWNEVVVRVCESGKADIGVRILTGFVEMGFRPEPGSWSVVVQSMCKDRKLLSVFELLDSLVS
ncbi:PREDICTED: pentatricopeptide repeat-containing protein At5g18475 isoform X2 [Tarenaya hassleriana]|uniref:pentatricopeptide repeat-containing protein At5g18475 isoform X2 n=1 Tax=Tarenaya hassleriana TaxID=28532 RepID=UPI00053C8F97|nr:PREDICTED: pentatricopeptide repeat-containing protein At5g18475 isoform X2 [Tarenaya hassleriana]